MLFKPLALATVATSFVIIPIMSKHDENIFKTLPVADSASPLANNIPETAFSQSLSVPCDQCKGHNTKLRLDLKIEDDARLSLNGFELYPNADPWTGDLNAAVINDNQKPKMKKLGYSLAVYPKATAKDDHMELIEVDIKIIEVGMQFVDGLPTVKVNLIKAPNGSLMMASAGLGKPAPPAQPECRTILCQVKKMADQLWAHAPKLKGCHKKKPSAKAASESEEANIPVIPGTFDQNLPSSDRDTWHRFIQSAAKHIVMPIILGIAAGVSFTLLALLIQAFVRLLVRVARGKQHYERLDTAKVSDVEAATVEEKEHLMS